MNSRYFVVGCLSQGASIKAGFLSPFTRRRSLPLPRVYDERISRTPIGKGSVWFPIQLFLGALSEAMRQGAIDVRNDRRLNLRIGKWSVAARKTNVLDQPIYTWKESIIRVAHSSIDSKPMDWRVAFLIVEIRLAIGRTRD